MQGTTGPERAPEQRDRLFERALAPRLEDLFAKSVLQGRVVRKAIWGFLDKIEDPDIQRGVRSDLAFRILPHPRENRYLTGVDYLRAIHNYERDLRAREVAFNGTPIFTAA